MATGATNSTGKTAAQFIDQKLRATRTQVRLVDLCSSIMTLLASILTYLLVLAVIDHWLIGFSSAGRWIAFLVFIIFSGTYVAWIVSPILFRRINPLYAARAIEEGTPAIKNGLINFLQLRDQPAEVHQQVFRAVEMRAAHDLASVPPDVTVDRSRMIRVGYLLASVLAIAACYKVLSPKDPFQTVSRIAAPWANIARPARVEIIEITPGDTSIFHGDSVAVSAVIRGCDGDARLVFSTADRRIVDREIPMPLDASGLRYACRLPPESSGIQQQLSYHIVAGDAISADFRVDVEAAPTIRVEQLAFEFPSYTGRKPLRILDSGDIEAVEGTKVTIHARANYPIEAAVLELIPPRDDRGGSAHPERPTRLAPDIDDDRAWKTVTLQMLPDRGSAEFSAYQLRFTSKEGAESTSPIRHQIEVLPDFSPEIEVLRPESLQTELPANGSQLIELRAVDPDYGLRRIELHATSPAMDRIHRILMTDERGLLGQQVKQTRISPRELGLEPGDRLTFWGIAEDNRRSAESQLMPNRTKSRSYVLVITPPQPGSAEPADREATDDSSEATKSGESAAIDDAEGDSEEGGNGSASSDGASESETGESGESGGAGQAQSESDPNAENEDDAAGAQGGAAADATQADSEKESTSPQGAGTQPGDGSKERDETDSQGSAAQEGGADGTGKSEGSGDEGQPSSPLHDGEVFERTLEHMQGDPSSGQSGDSNRSGEQDDSGTESAARDGGHDSETNRDASDRGAEPRRSDTPSGEATSEAAGAEANAEAASKDQSEPAADAAAKADEPSAGQRGGDAGAGEKSDDDSSQGATSDALNQDRSKSDSSQADTDQRDEPAGVSKSDRQSDSQGSSSGDKSGGGQQGAGQNADQAGKNSAGSNSASDEGAGAAAESGDGEVSGDAGSDAPAAGTTGQAGDQSGSGATERESPEGDQSGGDPTGSSSQPGDPQQGASSQGGVANAGTPSPQGGGAASDSSERSTSDPEVQPADAANLEYAEKATDLVLDYLADQQEQPDPRLLDKLGWTPEQLKDFLARWQSIKQGARERPGQRQLNEKLRSLGLRPREGRLREGDANPGSRLGGLRESGAQSPPPATYRDLFDAYRKGRARLRQSSD